MYVHTTCTYTCTCMYILPVHIHVHVCTYYLYIYMYMYVHTTCTYTCTFTIACVHVQHVYAIKLQIVSRTQWMMLNIQHKYMYTYLPQISFRYFNNFIQNLHNHTCTYIHTCVYKTTIIKVAGTFIYINILYEYFDLF